MGACITAVQSEPEKNCAERRGSREHAVLLVLEQPVRTCIRRARNQLQLPPHASFKRTISGHEHVLAETEVDERIDERRRQIVLGVVHCRARLRLRTIVCSRSNKVWSKSHG